MLRKQLFLAKKYLPHPMVKKPVAHLLQLINSSLKTIFSLLKGILFISLLVVTILPLCCLLLFVNNSESTNQEPE